ncbi:MAG: hypothetical protein KDB07_05735, partial [Planctomycetes bacterium]|nr:hypothetical protein [Planctomycetota bacterium]
MRTGAATSLLTLALVGCVGGPPGVKPKLVERPSEVRAWESELEKSPHDIRLYQKLIDFDLEGRDFDNARRTAYQCVDANPKSWEAWMLAAQVHRLLLSLRETEEALKNAVGFAPRTDGAARDALTSFYREVGARDLALRVALEQDARERSDGQKVFLRELQIEAGETPAQTLEVSADASLGTRIL